MSEDPIQFLTDVGYAAERVFNDFRTQVVDTAKGAIVTAVATRAAGMIFPLAPIALAGIELLRNAADVSRAARAMVGDMVQTVSDVLDNAGGDQIENATRMTLGTYRVATRGAGLALDLTTIVLGVRYLKTSTKHAAAGIGQRVNATIDGFLRAFQFTPPVLAGKPRPNILGAAQTFQWKRPDGTTDTHHVWLEGTADGKVTLHVASAGAFATHEEVVKHWTSKVMATYKALATHLRTPARPNGGPKKTEIARKLSHEVREALKNFIADVGLNADKHHDRFVARTRVRGLRMRLENNSDLGYVINQSKDRDLYLNMTLEQYLNINVQSYLDDHWSRYMANKEEKRDFTGNNKADAERISKSDRIHAHHIVMRNGTSAQGQNLAKIKGILKEYGLFDPSHGTDHMPWNLIWAPNRGHSNNYVRNVLAEVQAIRKLHVDRSTGKLTVAEPERTEMIDTVKDEGRKFFRGENTDQPTALALATTS